MAAKPTPDDSSRLRSIPGLKLDASAFDKLVHEPLRLGILSALAVHTTMTFTELKAALEATDGNVSVHARKLEDAGYLSCKKRFKGRTPQTQYRITAKGRRALESYLDHMEAVIRAARGEKDS